MITPFKKQPKIKPEGDLYIHNIDRAQKARAIYRANLEGKNLQKVIKEFIERYADGLKEVKE